MTCSPWSSCRDCDLHKELGAECLKQVVKLDDWNKFDFSFVIQMIDYLVNNNYYSVLPNYADNLTVPRIPKNLCQRNIDQDGFPPTPTVHFDDIYAERMETGNPAAARRVENTTAVPEETQSTSVQCHTRTCLCCECQEKYGSLPLFAQVLDSQQQTAAAKDGIDTSQPQSSTSTQETLPSTSSTKNQPFQCKICHKRFSHRGDYHKHIRIHSGDRPYTCAHCPMRFAHPSNRARHLRSHSTERPYHCDACNRKFYRKDKLDRHRMSTRCRKMSERQSKR